MRSRRYFMKKKIEEIIEYTNLIGFSKNMKKNMIKIGDKNKIKIE